MKNKKNQTVVQPEPALIEDNQPQNTQTPQIITKESLEREKQEQLELFDTPPAGVYPKTDKKGRVIKYKRRGGVFAFFMGIFASLFLFVFCGGITISYFYYCYTLEDAGKTLGVDLSFLGTDTTNKTASELLKLMSEYKEGYTEITVKDTKEKLGIDVADIVNKNLGVEVKDFYGIKIQVEGVNGGKETTIGDFKLKELTSEGNLQKVIEKLLPEIYKRVELNSLLKLLQIDITTIDLPITKDVLFQTELRQFKIGETTYAVDLTNSKILKNNTAVTTIENNKFTLDEVEYEISTDRTKLTSASTTLDLAFPENSQKELSKLSVYDLLYSVLPNYVGGSEMTIDFIQKALGKELIPTNNPEFAKLLNSTITNLNIKDALNTVTLRSIEKVFELSIVPLNNDKFNDLLNLTVGNLSTEDVLNSLTVGAVLELAEDAITFPDNILFLKNENFKAQKLNDALDYIENLTFKEIIKIDDVEFYDNFTLSGQTFFVVNNTIATKNTTTLTEQDGLQTFALSGQNFVLYGQQVFVKNDTTITFDTDKKFKLNGKTYYVNDNFTEILNESQVSLEPQVLIDNNCFELENYLCKIDKETNEIKIMPKQVDVENGRFTLNDTEFFVKDTCLENFVKVSDINEGNTFVLNGNTFKIDDENNQILDNSTQAKVSDITRTETIKLVMFGLRNVVVKDIIDGEYDDTLTSLDNITLGDLLGDQLTGFLSELKTVSLYEILNNPDVMLDKIKETTLKDLGVDPNSSPLLENVAKLTIGKILEDEDALLDAIKTVTLDKLGFESTSPLFEDVANLSIGNILDNKNALLDAIKNKTLSTITGSSDGIMSVIGNLTIGKLLDDSNAITSTLQTSTKTLAELLGQYDNFSLTTDDGTTKYYIIDSNIYKTSDLTNPVATISGDSFSLDDVNYTIDVDSIKNSEGATITQITRAPTSSLSKAILTMKVGDLFKGDFTTTLQTKIQNVKLGDVITTDETSPQLLKTLVDKKTTIGELGETINNLTLADVLGEVNSGLLTYLTYTKDGETKTGGNIPLANIADATLDGIEKIKLTKLCSDNVLPCLKGTVFDTTSENYKNLNTKPKQKEAVDNTTLDTIIKAYIDYITDLS